MTCKSWLEKVPTRCARPQWTRMQPVGWPPLSETLIKVVAKRVPIFAEGPVTQASDPRERIIDQWGAKFGSTGDFHAGGGQITSSPSK